MDIQRRLFIVGCPRSGTTLLQSLIAAHPNVVSFPESHFFVRLYSTRGWMRRLGLASRKARSHMEAYVEAIGGGACYRPHALPLMLRAATVCRAFIRTLDDLARRRGAAFWLEKTPRHLHHVADIEALVPNAHVIHLLRRGEDTIASLYHAMNTYPEQWGGPASLDACCGRWKRDVERSLKYLGEPGHTLVTYSQVADQTESTLQKLADSVGFEYRPSMIEDYAEASEEVIQDNEKWKDATNREIERRRSAKFRRLFDTEEQRDTIERVRPLNEALRTVEKTPSEEKNPS